MDDLAYTFQMAAWKIERANEHIKSVESVIQWIVDPSNYVVTPDRNPQTGHYMIRVGPKGGGLPHQLSVWSGDAFHCLASALDYVWSGMTRKAVPNLTTRAHFPRHEKRENLIDMVAKSAVAKAFPTIKDLIVDEIRPYKDGNFPVWAVGKLDNIDKHRLLIAAMTIARLGKFRAVSEDGSVIDLSYSTVQTYGPELTLAFAAPFKFDDNPELAVDVIFDEPEVLPSGQLVQKTLADFAQAVSRATETLKQTVL